MSRAPRICLALAVGLALVCGAVYASRHPYLFLSTGDKDSRLRIDHSAFDALLKKHVHDTRVDYAALKMEQTQLQQYIASLAALNASRYNREELLAFYINSYNAATLELILEHYPGIHSIMDLPAASSFENKRWTIAGELVSLNDIENKILRKRFVEPRVHFAINCASISCPPIRNEAYAGERIEGQLESQAGRFNREFGGAKWDAAQSTLTLSKIYEWYKDDFSRSGALKDYVLHYVSPDAAGQIARAPTVNLVFQEYNWALNDIAGSAK